MFFSSFCKDESSTSTNDSNQLESYRNKIIQSCVPFRLSLLTADERYILLNEGRGTGKSIFMTSFLLYKSLCEEYKNTTFLCAREYQNSIDESTYADLESQIDSLGLNDVFVCTKKYIINKLTNVRFVFKGLQKPYSIKSIKSISIIAIEEAGQVTMRHLDIVIPVLRGIDPKIAKVIFAMNRQKAKEDVESFLDRQLKNQVVEQNYWIKDLPESYQDTILLDQMEADFNIDEDLANWKWKNHPHPDQGNEPFRNINIVDNIDIDYKNVGRCIGYMDPSFAGGDYTALSIVYNYENDIYVHGFLFKQAHDVATAKISSIIKNFPTPVSFYYEDNAIKNAPQKNFSEFDILAKPKSQRRNKYLRIAEISGNKTLMKKLKFVNKRENLLYNKEFMNYNAEACRTNKSGFYDDGPDSLEGAIKMLQSADFGIMEF